jgi:hypothetical protein
VGSALLVAVTVTDCGAETVGGAAYAADAPLVVIEPMPGLNDHVTPVLDELLTDAVRLCTPDGYRDTAEGVIETDTGAGTTVNRRILLLPAGVATYTLCAPVATLALSVNVAVIVVELTTTTLP